MRINELRASSSLELRTVRVGEARTSIRLEPQLWEALLDIEQREQLTRSQLLDFIATRRRGSSLTSAVRVFISTYYWELFRLNQARTCNGAAPSLRSAAPVSAGH